MAIRRIENGVGTIPDHTALLGTATSNTDTTVLTYEGSNDIADIYRSGSLGENSTKWIYVPSGTPKIAKVVGIYQNADENWSIFLDTGIAGASGSVCNWLPALITYGYSNDGDTTITIDDVDVFAGDYNNFPPYQTYSNRVKFHNPVYVDATGGNLLITEEI